MRTTVVVLLAVRFVDESTGFLAPASVEDFRADLAIGYGLASAMFVAYAIGGVLGNLAVAATDGRNRKPVTVGGGAVLAAGLLVVAAAGDGWTMLAGTALVATGSTGLVHGGEIATAHAVAGGEQRLEAVLARGNLGAVAGDVLAPALLAVLRSAGIGWRPVFVGAAAVAAAYTALVACVRFPEPVAAPAVAATTPIRRQWLVWLLALSALATMPLDEPYLATVLAFAESAIGWSGAEAAALGVAFVVGGILAFTMLPGVVGRASLHRVLAVCGLGLAALMAVAAAGPGWLLVPVGVGHSTMLNALWLGEQATVLQINPGREGRTKLVVELLEGSSFLVVVAIGALADRAGLRAAMWAFSTLPLALIAVGAAMRASPSRARVSSAGRAAGCATRAVSRGRS